MESFSSLFVLFIGLLTIGARVESSCDQSAYDKCMVPYEKYETDVHDNKIKFTETELTNLCKDIDGIESCIQNTSCSVRLIWKRFAKSSIYLCGSVKAVYLASLKCYNDDKTLEALRPCNPPGTLIREGATHDQKCNAYNVLFDCYRRKYTESCGQNASQIIMTAQQKVGANDLPENCTLGGVSIQLSIWMMLAALLIMSL